MAEYRAFLVDDRRRVIAPPSVLKCADDAAAVEQAIQLQSSSMMEVWDRGRFIVLITKGGKAM